MAVAVAVLATIAVSLGQGPIVDFEADSVGHPPKGFSFALTGQGRPGLWVITRDEATHGNVLAQTDDDPTDYRFPTAIFDALTARDVDLTVQFKTVSGRGDQGAGLVWRYRDRDNYYVTRCNALENNCTIYRVVNGRRVAFANRQVTVTANVWHTLRVEATGDRFIVVCDGERVLDARDGVFAEAGRVGLWTKADSVIYFDNLSVSVRR